MKTDVKTETFVNSAGETVEYVVGSDNVFADLDLPDAEELALKSQLVARIAAIMREQKWSPAQAAVAAGLAPPKLSRLLRGHLGDFSVETLFEVLNRLGCDVEVCIKPRKAQEPGETRAVLLAA